MNGVCIDQEDQSREVVEWRVVKKDVDRQRKKDVYVRSNRQAFNRGTYPANDEVLTYCSHKGV